MIEKAIHITLFKKDPGREEVAEVMSFAQLHAKWPKIPSLNHYSKDYAHNYKLVTRPFEDMDLCKAFENPTVPFAISYNL